MGLHLPPASDLWTAIDLYLQRAYLAGRPTPTVQQRLDKLRAAGAEPWQSDVFEKVHGPNGTQYKLRLGNSSYPHMKLAIEPSPDQSALLFRADTHDHHIRPSPQSSEFEAFRALQERNSQLAAEIEAAWAQRSLMTFKEFLRRDLEQRSGPTPTSTTTAPPSNPRATPP